MGKSDGEPHPVAGQDCPALKLIKATSEITINGERLRIVQATDDEGKAIIQCLKERAESAPAGARIGRASALARAGLRFFAVVLLAAGVGIGLGDGDLYDDVGPSVAQQARRVSHGSDSGQVGEHPDGKVPGSDGGAGSGSDGGGPAGRPECEIRAEMCVNRMRDGLCRISRQQCLLFAGAGEVRAMLAEIRAGIVGMAMGPPVAGTKVPLVNDGLRTLGQFQYRPGFEDVWLSGEHFDLRKRRKARLCLEYLVAKKAFDAASARHFEDEIDPYVRKKGRLGARGKFSDIQIKQYFNDREGRLPRLRKALIPSVAGTGKYYLSTGAT